MNTVQFTNACEFIFTQDEIKRITVTNDQFVCIRVDLHGLGKYKAERFISDVINLYRDEFVLNLIHGYNHGTVLKSMILNEYTHKRISFMQSVKGNQGMTTIYIKRVA